MKIQLDIFPELNIALFFDVEPKPGECKMIKKDNSRTIYDAHQYHLELQILYVNDNRCVEFRLERKEEKGFKIVQYGVECVVPIVNIQRIWYFNYPHCRRESAWLGLPWEFQEFVGANRGTPFVLMGTKSGKNRFCVGFGNQILETELTAFMDQVSGTYNLRLSRPVKGTTLTSTGLKDSFFMSTKPLNWFKIAENYADWVDKERNFQPNSLPDTAFDPVWCSWYCFWDQINDNIIWENAKLAKELGIKTILIDAGWHAPSGLWGSTNGPLGDWIPYQKHFPNLRRLVDRIHNELNLLVELWCSPFWIGEKSQVYSKLQDAVIKQYEWGPILEEIQKREITQLSALYLCPQHPATKDHIVDFTSRLMREYNLDGLWIDFMDFLPLRCTTKHQHTYESMGEAFNECIRAMYKAITAVNSKALVEYRTEFANINNKLHANVYQATDTPHEFELRRRLTVMMRTCGKGIVVKNDPAIWNLRELDENVARHMMTLLINGVPALSVDFRKLPESHKRIIKRWLDFYQSHRQELILSDFQPLGFDQVFPDIIRESEKTCFLYISSNPFFLAQLNKVHSEVYIFNLTEYERLEVKLKSMLEGSYKMKVYNCFLDLVKESRIKVSKKVPILTLQVPQAGLVQLNLV